MYFSFPIKYPRLRDPKFICVSFLEGVIDSYYLWTNPESAPSSTILYGCIFPEWSRCRRNCCHWVSVLNGQWPAYQIVKNLIKSKNVASLSDNHGLLFRWFKLNLNIFKIFCLVGGLTLKHHISYKQYNTIYKTADISSSVCRRCCNKNTACWIRKLLLHQHCLFVSSHLGVLQQH